MTRRSRITLRTADPAHARKIHALISANLVEGHLLPRTLAELAPLSPQVAEVRSLAVDESARHAGVGSQLVEELRQRARREGYDKLCAFTHAPAYFIQMGFSIVPHLWLSEKIFTDCVKCPLFQRCGQFAMVLPLEAPSDALDREAPLVLARHA
jgi:amino-acid N-acetyltransferase